MPDVPLVPVAGRTGDEGTRSPETEDELAGKDDWIDGALLPDEHETYPPTAWGDP